MNSHFSVRMFRQVAGWPLILIDKTRVDDWRTEVWLIRILLFINLSLNIVDFVKQGLELLRDWWNGRGGLGASVMVGDTKRSY